MPCLLTNLKSLVKNTDALVTFLCEHKCDLAFITDSWLCSKNDLPPVPGVLKRHYDGIRCDGLYGERGGALLFIKNTVRYNVVFQESAKDTYEIIIADVSICVSCIRCISQGNDTG